MCVCVCVFWSLMLLLGWSSECKIFTIMLQISSEIIRFEFLQVIFLLFHETKKYVKTEQNSQWSSMISGPLVLWKNKFHIPSKNRVQHFLHISIPTLTKWNIQIRKCEKQYVTDNFQVFQIISFLTI